jgi:hypothetical protein
MIAGISDSPLPTLPEQLLPASVIARLDRLDMLSRKMLSGTMPGERHSKRRGRSVEFDDFRDYAPGDDLRHVDWNLYARLDRLYLKLFREEEDLAINILVDASASMDLGVPGKLVQSHRLAFALAAAGLMGHNRVSVATFAPRRPGVPTLSRLAPLRGRRSMRHVGQFLIDSLKASRTDRPAGPTNPDEAFNAAMRTFASSIGRRGVSIILSDFLSPRSIDPGLAAIGARTLAGHTDTWCLQILSPQELDPDAATSQGLHGDVQLTDVESMESAPVTITPETIRGYRERFEQSRAELKAACNGRGMAHVVISTQTPIEALLTDTIRRTGLLGG